MYTYEETQRFAPLLLVFIIAVNVVIAIAITYEAQSLAASTVPLAVVTAVALLLALLWMTATLTVRVDRRGLHVRTLYFIKRTIAFDEIQESEAVTYRPLRDYGGWGYRIGRRGKAYNMKGNEGVELQLQNGEKLLIGSQRAKKLAKVIQAHR